MITEIITLGSLICKTVKKIANLAHDRTSKCDRERERKHTLLYSLDIDEINALDFTDDKLALILNKLSDDETWQKSERAVNKQMIRVYEPVICLWLALLTWTKNRLV